MGKNYNGLKERLGKVKEFAISLGISTLVVYSCLTSCALTQRYFSREKNPRLIVTLSPNKEVISYSVRPSKTFIDEKPFGSLDYVVDNSGKERTERQLTPQDLEEFNKLEQKEQEMYR